MKILANLAMIAALVVGVGMHSLAPVSISNNLHAYPVLVRPMAQRVQWTNVLTKGTKHFESFKASPYRCPAGVLTVGYGHTGRHAGDYMTEATASNILAQELTKTKALVRKRVKVRLTAWQEAALVSFTHNTNESCLVSLISGPNRLNAGNYKSVERLLPRYCKAKGKTLTGLVRRRAWEVRVWRGEHDTVL